MGTTCVYSRCLGLSKRLSHPIWVCLKIRYPKIRCLILFNHLIIILPRFFLKNPSQLEIYRTHITHITHKMFSHFLQCSAQNGAACRCCPQGIPGRTGSARSAAPMLYPQWPARRERPRERRCPRSLLEASATARAGVPREPRQQRLCFLPRFGMDGDVTGDSSNNWVSYQLLWKNGIYWELCGGSSGSILTYDTFSILFLHLWA